MLKRQGWQHLSEIPASFKVKGSCPKSRRPRPVVQCEVRNPWLSVGMSLSSSDTNEFREEDIEFQITAVFFHL